eukprot:8586701-Pyramimonas_sp.AAC.1
MTQHEVERCSNSLRSSERFAASNHARPQTSPTPSLHVFPSPTLSWPVPEILDTKTCCAAARQEAVRTRSRAGWETASH